MKDSLEGQSVRLVYSSLKPNKFLISWVEHTMAVAIYT